jgi:hypothetical protein
MRPQSLLDARWWVLVLLVPLAVGCGDNGSKPKAEPGNPLTVPFAAGNRWEYTVTESDEMDSDSFSRTDEITGTVNFEGKSYWVVRTTVEETAKPQQLVSEAYLRQEGQELFQYIEFDTSTGIPSDHPLLVALRESVPWKVAEFTSVSGTNWDLVDASGNIDDGGVSIRVDIKITISNEGRTEVETEAGKFGDVYRGGVTQTVTVIPPPPLTGYSSSSRQDFYLKDEIGYVKEDNLFEDSEDVWERITSELTSYDLQQ